MIRIMTHYGIVAVAAGGSRQRTHGVESPGSGILMVRQGRVCRLRLEPSPLCPHKPTKWGVTVIDANGLRAAKIYPQKMRMRTVN